MQPTTEIPKGAEYLIDKPWTEIRESFRTGTFKELCRQIQPQIKKWEAVPSTRDPEAYKTANQGQVDIAKDYYSEFENPQIEKQDKGNKIHFIGRNIPDQETLTRVYIGLDGSHSADAFVELMDQLKAEGVLNTLEIAYNTEAVQDSEIAYNSLIIYDYASRPEVLDKVKAAYKKAKALKPSFFALAPDQRAKIMSDNLMYFKNAIDANFAFVEMAKEDGGNSYDSDIVHQTQKAFGIDSRHQTLDTFINRLSEVPGSNIFTKKAQLDFDKKAANGTLNAGDTFDYKRTANAPGLVQYGTLTLK